MKYRKALVTGGAGFIGSHIAALLLGRGIETVVYDNLYMGRKEYIPAGAHFVQADVLDGQRLEEAMAGVDVVFHDAARVSIRHSIENFHDDANVNIMGTVNVIQAMIRRGVKKIVYASSMAIYGQAHTNPIGETHPLLPDTPYGISKLTSEKYCLEMSRFHGFSAVGLRYFNTYGVRQTLTPYVGVITIFTQRLLQGLPPVIFGDGSQVRDFICAEDVARANLLAMEAGIERDVFNIGSGTARSVNDIARLLIQRIDPAMQAEHAPKQVGEPSSAVAAVQKAADILGFTARCTLEEKIDAIIEWNRRHPQGERR